MSVYQFLLTSTQDPSSGTDWSIWLQFFFTKRAWKLSPFLFIMFSTPSLVSQCASERSRRGWADGRSAMSGKQGCGANGWPDLEGCIRGMREGHCAVRTAHGANDAPRHGPARLRGSKLEGRRPRQNDLEKAESEWKTRVRARGRLDKRGWRAVVVVMWTSSAPATTLCLRKRYEELRVCAHAVVGSPDHATFQKPHSTETSYSVFHFPYRTYLVFIYTLVRTL